MQVTSLRTWLVDTERPGSLAARARARRMRLLAATFPDLASMRVLDLGGTVAFWALAPLRPAQVTLVNLDPQPAGPAWVSTELADACELPPRLRQGFDLVVSNSLIEHVGGHHRRHRLAETVRAAAPRHWVQTPNRHFPLEPHWVFPLQQYLPLAARVRVSTGWPVSHIRSADRAQALADVLSVELLDAARLRHYFPGSRILPERFAGLVKSLIAVRGG